MKSLKNNSKWLIRCIKTSFIYTVLLTAACNNDNSSNLELTSGTQQGIPIPAAIQAKAFNAAGTLHAYLYCDDKVAQPMTITGDIAAGTGEAQGSCTGLSTSSSHTIRVEFVFVSTAFNDRSFVLSTTIDIEILQVVGGNNNFELVGADFNYPDDDNDGITNLDELEAGTDPAIADTDAPLTTVTPAGGEYVSAQQVTLSCDDGIGGSGCFSTFYSTDTDAEPDQFIEYTGTNIDIIASATLRVFSIDNARNREVVFEETYVIDAAAPATSASLPSGIYIGSQIVKLSCNDGPGSGCAETYFSTDGNVPEIIPANLYQQPISITGNTVLQYFSVDNLGNQEGVTRQDYFIEGFTKTIAAGISTTTDTGPFNTDTYNHHQVLFRAEDIKGSGYIYSFKLRYGSDVASSITCLDTTIKLGQTSVTDLSNTFVNNVEQGMGSLFTVFDGDLVLDSANAGEYVEIKLSPSFNYNGVDNLILDLERTGVCDADVDLRYENVSPDISLLTSNILSAASGSTSNMLSHTKFVFSGGDDNIVYEGTVEANILPFGTLDNKVQQLYSAADIDGAGVINGVGFRIAQETTTQQSYSVSVRLGHSQLSNLTPTFADNFSDTPVTVASNVSYEVSAGMPVGSYFWIPFIEDNAFEYNGIDNLIVEIEVSSPTGDTRLSYSFVPDDARVHGASGATTGTVSKHGYFLKLRFTGGPINVITGGAVSLARPVTIFSSRTQFLYRAAELGRRGTVSGVRLRLNANSNPDTDSTYGDWRIYVGHSTNSILENIFPANMIDVTVVTTGTFTLPFGLLKGDWFDLSFDAPFDYDGARNLVIDLSSIGGSDLNFYRASDPSTLYAGRHARASDNTTDTATVLDDEVAEIQFLFE